MSDDVKPFKLVDYGAGKSPRFGIMLNDLWPGGAAFVKKHGEYVNGHTWATLISTLVARDAPALAKVLEYDPEAEMCVLRSDDRAALAQVARLVCELRADRGALDAAVEHAKKRD